MSKLSEMSNIQLQLWYVVFKKLVDENQNDPRVHNAEAQLKLVTDEMERRNLTFEEVPAEKIEENEDGTHDITIGLKPLELRGEAKLK